MFTIEKCWHIFCVYLSTHCWMNWSSDSHIILNSITETECSTEIGILCVFFNREYEFMDKYIWRCNSIWSDELTVILKIFFSETFFSQIIFFHTEVQLRVPFKVNMEMVIKCVTYENKAKRICKSAMQLHNNDAVSCLQVATFLYGDSFHRCTIPASSLSSSSSSNSSSSPGCPKAWANSTTRYVSYCACLTCLLCPFIVDVHLMVPS